MYQHISYWRCAERLFCGQMSIISLLYIEDSVFSSHTIMVCVKMICFGVCSPLLCACDTDWTSSALIFCFNFIPFTHFHCFSITAAQISFIHTNNWHVLLQNLNFMINVVCVCACKRLLVHLKLCVSCG